MISQTKIGPDRNAVLAGVVQRAVCAPRGDQHGQMGHGRWPHVMNLWVGERWVVRWLGIDVNRCPVMIENVGRGAFDKVIRWEKKIFVTFEWWKGWHSKKDRRLVDFVFGFSSVFDDVFFFLIFLCFIIFFDFLVNFYIPIIGWSGRQCRGPCRRGGLVNGRSLVRKRFVAYPLGIFQIRVWVEFVDTGK